MRRLALGLSRCLFPAPGFSSHSCRMASARAWKGGADADHDFSFGRGVCSHPGRWNTRQRFWRLSSPLSGLAASIPCATRTRRVLASLPTEHAGESGGVDEPFARGFLQDPGRRDQKDSGAWFCKRAAVVFGPRAASVQCLRRGNGVCYCSRERRDHEWRIESRQRKWRR